MPKQAVLFAIVAIQIAVNGATKVPIGFKFGVATASYQIEGGWNANGKGENVWDHLTHTNPDAIKDRTNGDIACDSYHLWRQDIELLKYLGVNYYRFSLSWPRLLPTGLTNKINPDGVRYYNDLINELLANNIEPLVTIFHWDLPQPLQEFGGWANPQIADYFQDYAEIVFRLFGDRVKKWITINEPSSICVDIYRGDSAPIIFSDGIGTYLCGKTLLLAHAKAYRIYDHLFRSKQGGKIGITIDSIWAEPKTNKTEDIVAAERCMQMMTGWWTHPIFSKNGDYPEIMKQQIANRSELEKFRETRLTPFSAEEVLFIRGTFDFFGLNHYTTYLITDQDFPITIPSYDADLGANLFKVEDAKPSYAYVPWGLRKLLNWVKNEYNNPLVYITENGVKDKGAINDDNRVLYLKEFINATLQAVEDGCNVHSYTHWSLMDNMEWRLGYTAKFGLYNVDFNSPNRTRTAKSSAKYYRNVIRKRTL